MAVNQEVPLVKSSRRFVGKPFLRSIQALFHGRWLRRNNYRLNLQEKERDIALLQAQKKDVPGLGRTGYNIGYWVGGLIFGSSLLRSGSLLLCRQNIKLTRLIFRVLSSIKEGSFMRKKPVIGFWEVLTVMGLRIIKSIRTRVVWKKEKDDTHTSRLSLWVVVPRVCAALCFITYKW